MELQMSKQNINVKIMRKKLVLWSYKYILIENR